jgi:hypothetical protein
MLFGGKTAAPPGIRAVRVIAKGFASLQPAEKQALAEILARLVPSLAAQGDQAQALPLERIRGILLEALKEAWTGALSPSKLLKDAGDAIATDPAAEELRRFCVGIAERCQVTADAPPL